MAVDAIGRAFAPLSSKMTTGSATVGTMPAKIVSGSPTSRRTKMVRVVASHETQALAVVAVDAGDDAPTVTADGSATDGLLILAGTDAVFGLRGDQDLYVVGAAAGTTYNLTVW